MHTKMIYSVRGMKAGHTQKRLAGWAAGSVASSQLCIMHSARSMKDAVQEEMNKGKTVVCNKSQRDRS